jgi:peptidoglycan/LPS O-acetylase OafA/YrhL
MTFVKELQSITACRDNNFNLLRIGAAIAVILSHSFILTGNEPNALPRILGYVAVNCFFVMSGFLVCKSLLDRNSILQFFRARALRIYPALVLSVVFCVLVVGPLFTTHSVVDYLTNSQTYKFFITNSILLVGDVVYFLPGVFEDTIAGRKVNAPLWTVFYEVYMYIAIASIAMVLGLRSSNFEQKFTVTLSLATLFLFVIFIIDTEYKIIAEPALGRLIRFGAQFGMGVCLYLHRSRIKLSLWVLLIMFVLIGVSSGNRLLFNTTFYLFLGYTLLCLAYLPGGLLLKYNRLGDYSYGFYIFAYPIQQALIHWYHGLNTLGLFGMAMAITTIFAVASWHLIESKALQLK